MSKFIILFARGYEVIVAFFLLKLMSDFLTPEEYAKLNLFVAITQGIALFFISPLQNWILVNNKEAQSGNWLTSLIMFELIYATFLATLAYIFCYYSGFNQNIIKNGLFTLFLAAIILPVLAQTVLPVLNLQGEVKKFVIYSLVGTSLGFIMPLIFVIIFKANFVIWLYGTLLAQFIIVIFILTFNFRIYSGTIFSGMKFIPFRKILLFSVPLSVAIGFQWYNAQGFRLSLQHIINLNMLGAFIMGFSFGGKFLNAIEKVFSTVLLPALYNRNDDASAKREWLIYVGKLSLLYSLSSIFVICLSHYIYPILISDEYSAGLQYIIAGVIFDMFRCIQNAVYQYNLISSKNHIQLIINMFMSISIFVLVLVIQIYNLDFQLFVISLPIIMASMTIIAFIINTLDKNENS